MQTVSFETAKALKEAGFPQPSNWNFGMVWYIPCDPDEGDEWDDYIRDEDGRVFGDAAFYAPTATDLLPEGWGLMRDSGDWTCWNLENPKEYFTDSNPAEAAAKARLFVKRKNDHK